MFPILNPTPTSLPSHPSGSSQCTRPEHPVSCIKPGLAIRFTCDNLHVSTPFSHIISLDHPRAQAPSILYPVLNIDWQFVSYMILYMFQYHSPKSSHPCPLPQSPKVCPKHLCLFCCLAYRVSHYHLSKFRIYVSVYCIGVFLSGLLHSV